MTLKEEKQLQTAFSKREKNEKLLSNLEKLKDEGSVTDDQYGSMKNNYTQIINEATSEIEQVKKGLSGDIESEEKTLETYKQELKNLEIRFKVGELSAEEYQKSEQKIKSKIEKAQANLSELKRLHDSKTSADVGGYVEPGERRGVKAISVGGSLPPLEDIIANKKILFGIIGVVAVIAIIAGIVLLPSGGTSAKDVMKQLPGSESFSYADCKTLRADKDLLSLWSKIEDTFGKFGKLSFVGKSEELYLIGGDLDLEAIRDEFDEDDLHKSRYMGVEVWKEDGDFSTGAVALLGDKVIIWIKGEDKVQEAIEVIKGKKASLCESNPEMTCIADKLPDGFLVKISSAPMGGIDVDYKDLEASGLSIQKMNKRRLKVQSVFMFDDRYSAENALDDIRSNFEEARYFDFLDNVEVSAQDRYVVATATCKIEDWTAVIW